MATFCRRPWNRRGPSSAGRARTAPAGHFAAGCPARHATGQAGRSPHHRTGSATTTHPRDVGDPAVQRHSIAPRVTAKHPGPPAVGTHQTERNADRGGLPGPVRPDKAVDLTRPDTQSSPSSARVLPNVFTTPVASTANIDGRSVVPGRADPAVAGVDEEGPAGVGTAVLSTPRSSTVMMNQLSHQRSFDVPSGVIAAARKKQSAGRKP